MHKERLEPFTAPAFVRQLFIKNIEQTYKNLRRLTEIKTVFRRKEHFNYICNYRPPDNFCKYFFQKIQGFFNFFLKFPSFAHFCPYFARFLPDIGLKKPANMVYLTYPAYRQPQFQTAAPDGRYRRLPSPTASAGDPLNR